MKPPRAAAGSGACKAAACGLAEQERLRSPPVPIPADPGSWMGGPAVAAVLALGLLHSWAQNMCFSPAPRLIRRSAASCCCFFPLGTRSLCARGTPLLSLSNAVLAQKAMSCLCPVLGSHRAVCHSTTSPLHPVLCHDFYQADGTGRKPRQLQLLH